MTWCVCVDGTTAEMYQENLDSNFKKMIFDAAKMYRKHRIRTKPKCAVYEPVGNSIRR